SPLLVLPLLRCPPPSSTLFPYTTLFRSESPAEPPRLGEVWEKETGVEPWVLTGVGGRQHGEEDMYLPTRTGYRTSVLNACRHQGDRKSTRLNSSHVKISYAVFCLKQKKN